MRTTHPYQLQNSCKIITATLQNYYEIVTKINIPFKMQNIWGKKMPQQTKIAVAAPYCEDHTAVVTRRHRFY